jgi:GPH family glycoside/pentoside/hexuronide:cation symporter
MSFRVVFAWMFGLLNGLLGYTVFLRGTPEQPTGLLNAAGYRPMAIFGAVTMFTAMLVSALATQRLALSRRQMDVGRPHVSIAELPRALASALRSTSYRAVVLAGLCLSVSFGLAENMNNYMNTFFWGFSSTQIGEFIIVIFFASLTVLAIARPLVQRFEPHHVALSCGIVMTILMPGLVGLKLIGVMPPTGDRRLFDVLAGAVFVLYGAIILGMTLMGTMIANVTDEHELATGSRQEGLLFSAAMFISKASSGLGVLAAGIVLKLIQFPNNAKPGAVDPSVVQHLGQGSAGASLVLGLATVFCFSRFTLTRARHKQILDELAERRNLPESAAGLEAAQ